eukprot:gene15954-20383_t
MASSYNSRPLAPEVMVDGTSGSRPGWSRQRPNERTSMDASQTTPTIQAPGLGRKIGLAWAALAWEGLWPRVVPLLSCVALFVAAAHLDLFAGLDPWVHTGILGALALAFAGLAWWQLRDFSWPAREEATRRLERDSEIPHRPLAAVQDNLAAGNTDPMAVALWE